MAYTKNKTSRNQRPRALKPLLFGVATLAIVAAVFTGLELTNTTHLFHDGPLAKKLVIPTTNPKKTVAKTTDTSKDSTAKTEADTTTNNSKDTVNGGAGTTTTAALISPSGTFVSNHHPSLSDPDSYAEVSVCTTTPGATCAVTFTLGDVVRTLPSQTVDSSGSTTWKWNASKDSGFAAGTWKVSVTANLNGSSQAATDTLVVSP